MVQNIQLYGCYGNGEHQRTMKNQTNQQKISVDQLGNGGKSEAEKQLAAPAPDAMGRWARCKAKICGWLEQAQKRVDEGFRVPPGGG